MNPFTAILNKNLWGIFALVLIFGAAAPAAFAGYPSTFSTNTPDNNQNAQTIEQGYQNFAPPLVPPGTGVVNGANGAKLGPGRPVPIVPQAWPVPEGAAVANTDNAQEAAELEKLNSKLKPTGLPPSDSYMNALLETEINQVLPQKLNDPQNSMWAASAIGNLAATSAANSLGSMAENQLESAIMFIQSFLTNFTAESGNQWQAIRTQLFIPMAILLLLPGAVLAQVKAIIAQGSPILGEVSPFEGITRSIVAIFMIPATALVMNYGIDVSNAVQFAIAQGYFQTFGSNMYADAIAAQQRAFPENSQSQDDNSIPESPNGSASAAATEAAGAAASGGTNGGQGYQAIGEFEGENLDPAVPDEQQTSTMAATRLMMNGSNSMLATTWNIMCAFQMAFLYYLWCMGPIVAALWVWPLERLRSALPSWIEGVVTLCFWSLFWNTTILLMACFKGIGDTGTVMMTALNALANICVLYAFDFSSLISQGAASQMVGAVGQALSKASSGGGASGGGGQSSAGGAKGARGGGSASANTGMQTPMQRAARMGMGTGLGNLAANSGHAAGHGVGGGEAGGMNSPSFAQPTAVASAGGGHGAFSGAIPPGSAGGAQSGLGSADPGIGAAAGAPLLGENGRNGALGEKGMPFGMGVPPGTGEQLSQVSKSEANAANEALQNAALDPRIFGGAFADANSGQPGVGPFGAAGMSQEQLAQAFGNNATLSGDSATGGMLPSGAEMDSALAGTPLANVMGQLPSGDALNTDPANLGGLYGLPPGVGNLADHSQLPPSVTADVSSMRSSDFVPDSSAINNALSGSNLAFDTNSRDALSFNGLSSDIQPLAAHSPVDASFQALSSENNFDTLSKESLAGLPMMALSSASMPNIEVPHLPIPPVNADVGLVGGTGLPNLPQTTFGSAGAGLQAESHIQQTLHARDAAVAGDQIVPYGSYAQQSDANSMAGQPGYAQQQVVQNQAYEYAQQQAVQNQATEYTQQQLVQNQAIEYAQQQAVQNQATEYAQQQAVQNQATEYAQQQAVQNQAIEYAQQQAVQNQAIEYAQQQQVVQNQAYENAYAQQQRDSSNVDAAYAYPQIDNSSQTIYQDYSTSQGQTVPIDSYLTPNVDASPAPTVIIGESSYQSHSGAQHDALVSADSSVQQQQQDVYAASSATAKSQPQNQAAPVGAMAAIGGFAAVFAKNRLGSSPRADSPSSSPRSAGYSSASAPPASMSESPRVTDASGLQGQITALKRAGGKDRSQAEEDEELKKAGEGYFGV